MAAGPATLADAISVVSIRVCRRSRLSVHFCRYSVGKLLLRSHLVCLLGEFRSAYCDPRGGREAVKTDLIPIAAAIEVTARRTKSFFVPLPTFDFTTGPRLLPSSS